MPLTTAISLTAKQKEALELLDSPTQDKLLLLGGSGSGKTFVLIYKAIRDALRFKAPVLVCRNMFVDLRQGVMDQIMPAILQSWLLVKAALVMIAPIVVFSTNLFSWMSYDR